jgi:hypothetical protein
LKETQKAIEGTFFSFHLLLRFLQQRQQFLKMPQLALSKTGARFLYGRDENSLMNIITY